MPPHPEVPAALRRLRHLRRPADPSAGQDGRVPPGQYVTEGFPVLSAGPTPHTPLPEWTFSIRQADETLKSWTWQEFRALPAETVTADIHCVTRWTKLDTVWRGVSVDTLLEHAEHDAPYVLAFCDGGYTSNLPVKDVAGGSGIVPLRAILRHRQRSGSDVPVCLLYSTRTLPDAIYRSELDQYRDGTQVIYTLTRSQPPGWTGYSGRVDAGRYAVAADGALTALGSTLVENNPASHPLDEGVSAGQNYLYVLANGLSQIVGYRVGAGGSLTQVTTVPVASGSGGIGAS